MNIVVLHYNLSEIEVIIDEITTNQIAPRSLHRVIPADR